ncbi:MAG: PP2C family protein-serine/threonine phosphatase [Angustibacter sp.]
MSERDLGRRTAWAAVGWLAVVLLAEVLTGRSPDVVLSPFYGLAPLIACAALPWPGTAAFGLVAVLLSVASGLWTGTLETDQHLIRMVTVALMGAVAVFVADVRERRDQRFRRLARIADVAQRSILPIVPTRVGPVRTATRYVPAVEDTLVGGDLFDCFSSAQHTCFVVGDVRGKGVGAIEQAARVIRAFRQAAAASTDLATIAADMSTYLVPFLDEEEFATAVLVQVRDGSTLTIVSCGHPPPLLVDPASHGRLIEAPAGFPLGLGDEYAALDVPWSPGDRLLLYTDGLSEVRDVEGEFLPVAPMARQLVGGQVDEALERLLATVRERAWSKNATDDLALLLIENVGELQPALRLRPLFARQAR